MTVSRSLPQTVAAVCEQRLEGNASYSTVTVIRVGNCLSVT